VALVLYIIILLLIQLMTSSNGPIVQFYQVLLTADRQQELLKDLPDKIYKYNKR